ncbi:MAG: hypothetical protein MZU79_02395, partial [Anaerotruncus sp.]|nr:hypothetical protein [Anaerotruncus sp.]
MLAFAGVLESKGKTVDLVAADPVPSNYRFLHDVHRIRTVDRVDCANQAIIFIECRTVDRCGITLINPGPSLNFDHHPDNKLHGDLILVDPDASSVGEMAVAVIRSLYGKSMKPWMADCLYTAIHTDTGGFSYINTTSDAFDAASWLLRQEARSFRGHPMPYIHPRAYGKNQTHGHLYGKSLRLKADGKLCFGALTLDDFSRTRDNYPGTPTIFPRSHVPSREWTSACVRSSRNSLLYSRSRFEAKGSVVVDATSGSVWRRRTHLRCRLHHGRNIGRDHRVPLP